jgi:hypothetical protein
MYGFVYIWHDRKKKRFYIGSHKGSFNDKYICSSSWMKNAYKKRPEDFKRRILSTVQSKIELFDEEQKYLNMIKDKELGKRYYNLKKSAYGGFSSCAIKAAREYNTGRPLSEEHKRKQSESLKNKCWTDDRKKAQIGTYTKRLRIKYNDIIFSNIEDAVKFTGKSKSTIRRWCDNINNLEWSKFRVD